MTKLLTYVTAIFLIIGIPISTIYWWPQFWGPQFSLATGYWDQWIHGLKIASAVLAALWVLRLVLWIRSKREASKFYGAMGRDMNVSARREDWRVNKEGQAFHPEDEPQSEPISYIVPEPLISQSVFQQGKDFLYKYHENEHARGETDSTKEGKMKNYENDARILLMKQEVSRLVEEGRLPPNEAIKLRRDIENSIDSPETYLDTKHFPQAIRHRPSK